MAITRTFDPWTDADGNEVIIGTGYPEFVIRVTKGTEIHEFYPNEYDSLTVDNKLNLIPVITCRLFSIKRHDGMKLTVENLEKSKIRVYKVIDGTGKQIFAGVISEAKKSPKSYQIDITGYGYAHCARIQTTTKMKEAVSEYALQVYESLEGLETRAVGARSSFFVKYAIGLPEAFAAFGISSGNITYDIESDPDYRIVYRREAGNSLTHLSQISKINFWDWWVEETDNSVDEAGVETTKITVHTSSEKGKFLPNVVYETDVHLITEDTAHDKDKLKNIIQATGGSNATSNIAGYYQGTFAMGDEENPTQMGYVISNESKLAQPVSPGATSITLVDATDYLQTGKGDDAYGEVQIGDEKLKWVRKGENDPNKLVLQSPAVDYHSPGDDVLMLNLLKAYIHPSMLLEGEAITDFMIGYESVMDATVTPWGLEKMTRSSDNGYCHREGTKIFRSVYSLSSAHEDSSIGKYGRQDMRINAIGASDHDGVDKFGISVLLALQGQIDYGSINIALDELPEEIEEGDYIYVKPYDSEEKFKVRITGIQYTEEVAILYYGTNDEYINQQFENIGTVEDSTYCRDDKIQEIDIIQVSPDGRSALVKDDAENYKWVRIR